MLADKGYLNAATPVLSAIIIHLLLNITARLLREAGIHFEFASITGLSGNKTAEQGYDTPPFPDGWADMSVLKKIDYLLN